VKLDVSDNSVGILSAEGVVLRGVMVIVLVIGPKNRRFTFGLEPWIFKGDKNP
jgi:hypothetical protein